MAIRDEELMRRAARQDLSAFGELFDRYRPRLLAFLCRILGDPTTAEDVTQEVFWRVWRDRAAFDPRRPFSNWLYTIARHTALDELKKPYRRAALFSELSLAEQHYLEADLAAPGALRPDDMASRLAVRLHVQQALQALPADQRVAIVLREYDGKSHREIGEILGCSEGNARVLTHRARRALQALLKPLIENPTEEKCKP